MLPRLCFHDTRESGVFLSIIYLACSTSYRCFSLLFIIVVIKRSDVQPGYRSWYLRVFHQLMPFIFVGILSFPATKYVGFRAHTQKRIKGFCNGFCGSKRRPPTSSLCWSGRLFVSLHIRFYSVQSVAIFPISQINKSMSIPFYSILSYSILCPFQF